MTRAEDGIGIVNDCTSFEKEVENRVIQLVGRAVGMLLPALWKDPRKLPGQLIGRLGGTEEAKVQQQNEVSWHEDGTKTSCLDFVHDLLHALWNDLGHILGKLIGRLYRTKAAKVRQQLCARFGLL
jgi:hypothetical protein